MTELNRGMAFGPMQEASASQLATSRGLVAGFAAAQADLMQFRGTRLKRLWDKAEFSPAA